MSAMIALTVSGVAAAASLKPIYKIDSAAASIRDGKLTIIAAGATSTGGWSKARLRLKPGHKAESDTLDFDFVAVPPPSGQTVIQMLVPVTVTLTTKLPPYGVTQIRVNAEDNSTTAEIRH
jgi:hypothetical protein